MTRKARKKLFSELHFYLLLILIGLATLGAAMLFGSGISKLQAQNNLDRSLAYLKSQCLDYTEVLGSDEIKSLIRLTEKAQSISYAFSVSEAARTDDFVRDFAEMQRLACLFILDENLQPEYQYCKSGNGLSDWSDVIANPAIQKIVTSPSKIYASRVTREGSLYDIGAAARKDSGGIVFAVRYQSSDARTSFQLALEDMLAGYDSNLNGKLYITDGQTVVGSSQEEDYRKGAADIACIAELDRTAAGSRLTRISADGRSYYGGRSSFQNYQLYAVFEQKDVFSFCHSLMLMALATYCILMIFVVLIHNRIRNRHLEEVGRQFEIIRSVSKIYLTNILVNIKSNRLEFLSGQSEFPEYDSRMNAAASFEKIFFPYVADANREAFRRFCDFPTMSSRLKDKDYIEISYQNYRGEWLNDMIIPNDVTPDGEVTSFLLVTKSIDAQKRLELEYQQKLEQAVANEARASRAKTDFLRQMSHDVRTPINVILGMMEIEDQHPDDPQTLADCRNKAREAATFLLELVNDILTINKLNSGNFKMTKRSFSLHEAMRKIYSIVKCQARNKSVSIECSEINILHDQVLGEPLYVQQIVLNVVSNAIKYSRSGSTVLVSIKETAQNDSYGEYTFTCTDHGIGMSEEFQKRMFEPFSQEASEVLYSSSGIGLGLSVVKKLTDTIGGRIHVESRKNHGTRFEIILPFTYALREKEEAPAARTDKTDISGLRVLIAEDNELNMEIAEHFLKNGGAEIVKAKDGKAAVEIFSAAKPGEIDVILMDMMMPVMSGTDAARAIRALDRPDAKAVPILAITANLFDEDIAACLSAGMNGHIAKPISQSSLIQAIWKYTKGGV